MNEYMDHLMMMCFFYLALIVPLPGIFFQFLSSSIFHFDKFLLIHFLWLNTFGPSESKTKEQMPRNHGTHFWITSLNKNKLRNSDKTYNTFTSVFSDTLKKSLRWYVDMLTNMNWISLYSEETRELNWHGSRNVIETHVI